MRIVSTMKYDGARAAGTGMVLTSDGEVVTNHHVVEGATSIKVKVMSTGKSYVATVVGTDAKDDVAVLQLAGASGLEHRHPRHRRHLRRRHGHRRRRRERHGRPTSAPPAGTVLATGGRSPRRTRRTATGERLTGLIEISSDVVSGDSRRCDVRRRR